MSGKVVNLRAARKARDRAAKRAAADANAAKHGESRAARTIREAEADRIQRTVDGARREAPDDDDAK
jgi:hypothetical protein